MAATVTSQPVKIREYLKFQAPMGFRDELIFGEIVVSPEPKVLHYQVAENVYKLLEAAVGKQFKVAQRINLRFPEVNSMPSPDVFVLSRKAFNSARDTNAYPDGKQVVLAVEVLSPGNRKKNIDSKIELYSQFGIEAWIVSSKDQNVKVYRKGDILTALIGDHLNLPFPFDDSPGVSVAAIFNLS